VSFRNARRAGEPFAFCGIPSLRDRRHRSVRFRSKTVVISFSISLRAQDIVPGIRLHAGERDYEIARQRETIDEKANARANIISIVAFAGERGRRRGGAGVGGKRARSVREMDLCHLSRRDVQASRLAADDGEL